MKQARRTHTQLKHAICLQFSWLYMMEGGMVLVEREVPYPSTNNQLNPSVIAILGQRTSLSTGTLFHSLFLTYKPHLNLPLIAYRLRTSVSLLRAHEYSQRCYRGCERVEGCVCLALLVQESEHG